MTEYLDIVDEKDTIVTPHVPYEEVHALKARHRAVHVLLFNDADEILIQLRSEKKKAFPLHWTFSAGGHVRHKESYEKAAVREIKEELELDIPEDKLVLKGKGIYTDELDHKIYYQTYAVTYDGPIEVTENDEVKAVQFVTWQTLQEMMRSPEHKIHSELIEVLTRHWSDYL